MGPTNLCPITRPHNFPMQWPFDHPPPDLMTITHIALARCQTFNGPRAWDMGSFARDPFAYVSTFGIDHVPLKKYRPTPISSLMTSKTTPLTKWIPIMFIKHFFPAIFQPVTVKSLLTPIFTLFHSNRITEPLRLLRIPKSCNHVSTIRAF